MRRHSENGISHSKTYFLNSTSCSENTPKLSQSSEKEWPSYSETGFLKLGQASELWNTLRARILKKTNLAWNFRSRLKLSMARFTRIDSQIRANGLILANRFRVRFFANRASGGYKLRIADLRRFARIARTS